MKQAGDEIVAALGNWRAAGATALVVAIDGYGASGKTTLAKEVGATLDAVVLHTDDHLHAAQLGDDPRPMAQYYDWERLRGCVTATVAPVILVEGVSSASPALADLVTHAVFVATPEPVRLQRLHARVSDQEWDEAWLVAERVYFATRPPESFDLVVSGA